MKLSVPPAVLEAAGPAACSGTHYWYEQDLSIEELTQTVATINAALRATRV